MIRVNVSDNKYTVLIPETAEERLVALRYGEPWRDLVGDKLILGLAQELHDLREFLANNFIGPC